jgi:hypothetical protein
MRALAVALVLVTAVAAGCGASGRSSEETTASRATTTTATGRTSTVVVYVARNGKVAAERRVVPATRAVGRAALDVLGLPVTSLTISDGTAHVDLARAPTELERARIVFTLTEFPTVQRVEIGGRVLTRTDVDMLAPPIVVTEPQPGDTVSSPVRVRGSADTFEATFQIDVVDRTGTVVAHRTVTATSGSGERGTYDVSIPYAGAESGPGRVVAYEDSAADGSRIHVVETPVVLR